MCAFVHRLIQTGVMLKKADWNQEEICGNSTEEKFVQGIIRHISASWCPAVLSSESEQFCESAAIE